MNFLRLFGFFLFFVVTPLSGDHEAAAQAAVEVVATIDGEDVEYTSLLPKPAVRDAKRKTLSKEQYSLWTVQYAAASLRARVLKKYRTELSTQRGLAPSAEQVEKFITALGKIDEMEGAQLAAEVTKLEQAIGKVKKGSAEYAQLSTQLTELQDRKRQTETRLEFTKTYPELKGSLDRGVAERFLTDWLIDRELFLEYRGKVSFRYGGPEPVEAHYQFLRAQQRAKRFTIHSRKLSQEFWRYFFSKGQLLLIPNEDAEKLYQTPWWENIG
jgi:hypothetical protein